METIANIVEPTFVNKLEEFIKGIILQGGMVDKIVQINPTRVKIFSTQLDEKRIDHVSSNGTATYRISLSKWSEISEFTLF
jgi:hypothetical protein